MSRFFGPQCGVPEDPVTGSAHSCLTPYWDAKLGAGGRWMRAEQRSKRGGALRVVLDGDRVRMAGDAHSTLRGTLLTKP